MKKLPTPGAKRRAARSTSRLLLESLEPRTLLSVVGWVGIIAPADEDSIRRFAGNITSPDNPTAEIRGRLVIAWDDANQTIWNSGEFIANQPTVNDHPSFNPTGHAFDEVPPAAQSAPTAASLPSATAYLYAFDPTTQQWLAVDTVSLPAGPGAYSPFSTQLIGRAALNPNGSGLSIGEDPSFVSEIQPGPGFDAGIVSSDQNLDKVFTTEGPIICRIDPDLPPFLPPSNDFTYVSQSDLHNMLQQPAVQSSTLVGNITFFDSYGVGPYNRIVGRAGYAYDAADPSALVEIRLVTTRTLTPASGLAPVTYAIETTADASSFSQYSDSVTTIPAVAAGHSFRSYLDTAVALFMYDPTLQFVEKDTLTLYAFDSAQNTWVMLDTATDSNISAEPPAEPPAVPSQPVTFARQPSPFAALDSKNASPFASLTFLTQTASFSTASNAPSFTAKTFGDPTNYTLTVQLPATDTKKSLLDTL